MFPLSTKNTGSGDKSNTDYHQHINRHLHLETLLPNLTITPLTYRGGALSPSSSSTTRSQFLSSMFKEIRAWAVGGRSSYGYGYMGSIGSFASLPVSADQHSFSSTRVPTPMPIIFVSQVEFSTAEKLAL